MLIYYTKIEPMTKLIKNVTAAQEIINVTAKHKNDSDENRSGSFIITHDWYIDGRKALVLFF